MGILGTFEYNSCRRCGCVQAASDPPPAAELYPSGYYSLRQPALSPLRVIRDRVLRSIVSSSFAEAPGRLALAFARLSPDISTLRYSDAGATTTQAAILDVGGGVGARADRLARYGFSCVTSIDPSLAENGETPSGARLLAASILEVEGIYDVIMMHHSLEHIDDQVGTLKRARALLAPAGMLIVRVPLVSGASATKFGEKWVQFDAPRHRVLHTEYSLRNAASAAGLSVVAVKHDSTEFQFWGSRRFVLRQPLRPAPLSVRLGMIGWIWPRTFIDRLRARRLNKDREGDQAIFWLVDSGETD